MLRFFAIAVVPWGSKKGESPGHGLPGVVRAKFTQHCATKKRRSGEVLGTRQQSRAINTIDGWQQKSAGCVPTKAIAGCKRSCLCEMSVQRESFTQRETSKPTEIDLTSQRETKFHPEYRGASHPRLTQIKGFSWFCKGKSSSPNTNPKCDIDENRPGLVQIPGRELRLINQPAFLAWGSFR